MSAALVRLRAVHRISYTMDHCERTKKKQHGGGATAVAAARKADAHQGLASPHASLDPDHWSAPVAPVPAKAGDGATYQSSISLLTLEDGEKLSQLIFGPGTRQDAPLALAVLGRQTSAIQALL